MAPIFKAHVNKPLHFPSSFKFPTWKMNQGIDLANIHGLI